MRRHALWLLLAASTLGAAEEPAPEGGPFEWREKFLIAQPRLTLPPVSPVPLTPGRTEVKIDFDWGNDLGWKQPEPGESPVGRGFLIDGEHRTLALDIRHGLAPGLDMGLRLPLEWRGGGILDGVIDWYHSHVTDKLGLPDNGRPEFLTNQFRIDLIGPSGRPLTTGEGTGTGLGRAELFTRFAPFEGKRVGVVARIALPTGSGPFEDAGVMVGLQLVAALPVFRSGTFYAGGGATGGGGRYRGEVEYSSLRSEGFLAFERKLSRRFSAVAQTQAAGRVITGVPGYPGIQWYVSLGARLHLDSGLTLEGGFTENIMDQEATTDFAVEAGVTRSFGSRRR